jgi:hypothetical protein
MNKYRVLKPYPKQITNSGRLVTLKKGNNVYLKQEAQVLRLIELGFLRPIVEIPKKEAKPQKEVKPEAKPQEDEQKRMSKSEYLNKKNKAE